MTVIINSPYAGNPTGSTLDLDNATEAALVAQGRAAYSGASPGPVFQPLTPQQQQNLADFTPSQIAATQALVSGAANRVVVADTAFSGTSQNANAHLNALFAAASAAYSTTLGRVRVVVPAGIWQVERIRWRENVEYDFRGAVIQAHPTAGNTSGPLTESIRDFTGSTWYGKHRNIRIVGGTFIPNNIAGLANVVQMDEFEDSEIIDMTVQHQTLRTGWAWVFSGRRCKIVNPTVLGGIAVFQDGLHLTHGNRITVLGGYIKSGDDSCVCGSDIGVTYDDEDLSDVTWTGTVADSTNGFACSLYYGQDLIAAGGTQRRLLRNITMSGITGYAGQVTNGGIRVIDTSVSGGPGTNNTVIRNVSIQAKLNVGSASHTGGTQAFGIHVTTGNKVTIDADLTMTDTTGGATRFRPFILSACDDITLKVRQTGLLELPARILPFTAAHTINDWKLIDCDLIAANVASGVAVDVQNGFNGTLNRGLVRGGNLREIPDGGYGVLAQGANSVGSLRLEGTTYLKKAGATTAAGYNASTAAIVSHITMLNNDFSDVSIGSPGNLFAANHNSFFVDANRNFPNKQAGTVTLLAAATTATITISGSAVRFSTLTSPANTQVTVTPTDSFARATPVSVTLASATTATITSTAVPGTNAVYAWSVDTGRKPV